MGLLTASEQDRDGVPSWCCSQAKPVWHIPLLCVQWKTDDGLRNCPKHVEIYSKNKFEKLVHPFGFVIRIYHDARSPERRRTLSCSYLFTDVTVLCKTLPNSVMYVNTMFWLVQSYRFQPSRLLLQGVIYFMGRVNREHFQMSRLH